MSINNPITRPTQLCRPLICRPLGERYKKDLESMWWSTNSTRTPANKHEAAEMNKMFALRDKILAFGGHEVCMPLVEDDYFAIMKRGQFFYGDHAHLKKGLPSHCHCNAAQFWAANKGRCQICTGYALSEDGIWRQHSWVVQPLTRSWRIWETTVKRVAYFGVIFDDAECERFYASNG